MKKITALFLGFLLCISVFCLAETEIPDSVQRVVSGVVTYLGGIVVGGTNSRVTFSLGGFHDGGTDDIQMLSGDDTDTEANIIFNLSDLTGGPVISTSSDTITVDDRLEVGSSVTGSDIVVGSFISTDNDTNKAVFIKNITTLPMNSATVATYGLYMNPIHAPILSSTKGHYGIYGENSVQGANFGSPAFSTAISFNNSNFAGVAGGSDELDLFGMTLTAAFGNFALLTADEVVGAKIVPTNVATGASAVAIGGDYVGIQLLAVPTAARADTTIAGDFYQLFISEETVEGANQYQTVMGGSGTTTGIYLDGITGEHIYSDGTNFVSNSPIKAANLAGSYTGASAYVCVGDDGVLFASEGACP